MRLALPFAALLPLLLATACADTGSHYQAGRNTVNVVETPEGLVAVAPACTPFTPETMDSLVNDPMPQLGCATAGNLAAQIVNPADLVRGELYPDSVTRANGTVGAAAVQRYHEGKVYQPTMTEAATSSK